MVGLEPSLKIQDWIWIAKLDSPLISASHPWPKIFMNWAAQLPPRCKSIPPSFTECYSLGFLREPTFCG